MSNALTTKARVKDRIKVTSTDFDTLIDNLIVAVTARIEVMCHRKFTLATYTSEIHDGGDLHGSKRTILIPVNAPIASVSTIEYKVGSNTTPNWTAFNSDNYDIDYSAGIIYFHSALPAGMRNIRITYTAGWDGYAVGVANFWNFNVTPSGDVDGVNRTFTLTENADEIIVYADGVRLASSNITFTAGTATFTIASGAQPYSTIAIDYKETLVEASGDPVLPAEIVDLCERVVVYLFKKRDSEGKTTETFAESSIVWRSSMFTPDMLATIKNYRRGYEL